MTEAQRKLLETLDALAAQHAAAVPGDVDGDGDVDAIDRVLSGPARENRAVRLRDSEEFQKFREALTDGLIANDAAIAVLGLINKLIDLKVIRF